VDDEPPLPVDDEPPDPLLPPLALLPPEPLLPPLDETLPPEPELLLPPLLLLFPPFPEPLLPPLLLFPPFPEPLLPPLLLFPPFPEPLLPPEPPPLPGWAQPRRLAAVKKTRGENEVRRERRYACRLMDLLLLLLGGGVRSGAHQAGSKGEFIPHPSAGEKETHRPVPCTLCT
jgi:hypothetical protein